MPRIDKTVFTDFVTTGCEKQLRINLHPHTKRHLAEREAINLPMPQIRPALQELRAAGDRWGWQKVFDLQEAFGKGRLRGSDPVQVSAGSTRGLRFQPSDLLDYLNIVRPGDFVVEGGFPVGTSTFRRIHGLGDVNVQGEIQRMRFLQARPDLIEVLASDPRRKRITADGELRPQLDDGKLALRIIDVKLNSEPGPKYFSELAYYALALAAFLVDSGQDNRFVVSADAAIWPGSESDNLSLRTGADTLARYEALHDSLVVAPMRVFITEAKRVLQTLVPSVLEREYESLPWAVTPRCQGCENLGQKWLGEDSEAGERASDYRPGHCIPTALETDHLSRFPFLSRGSMQVLREFDVNDVHDAAGIGADHPAFSAHHRLRAQRGVIADRATALSGEEVPAFDPKLTSTAAVPAFSDLRMFITADFDSSTAITLAFGFTWAWLGTPQPSDPVAKNRVHQVDAGNHDAEWNAFSALLSDIHDMLSAGQVLKPNATVQLYVWDSLTLDHLSRVASRHLGRLIADQRFGHLAWLFPPQEIVGNSKLSKTPAVSVVRDVVRTLMALPLAHNYNLLDTARHYQSPDSEFVRTFTVPPFWSDPFSDQIPPERAHQMWTKASTRRYTHNDVANDLGRTVRTKLAALASVTDHLLIDLRGRLPRQAPGISDIRAPRDPGTTSVLGSLVLAYTRLDGALQELKTSRTNSLPLSEREARFDSALLESEVLGAEARSALRAANLNPGPHRKVFRLSEGSTDVKAKVGDFLWSVLPQSLSHMSTMSYTRFVQSVGNPGLADRADVRLSKYRSLGQVFAASIVALSKEARLVVVDFNEFHSAARISLLNGGFVDLSSELVMDQLAQDFLSPHVEKAWKAIKNPPFATSDARIRTALGMTRQPRVGAHHPAEQFIWNPLALTGERIERPTSALLALQDEREPGLNASQLSAWTTALTCRLTLIWGPPGTGKTATLLSILESLAADSNRAPLRIAVTAPTYAALDNLIRPAHDAMLAAAPSLHFKRLAHGDPPDWLGPAEHTTGGNRRSGYRTLASLLESAPSHGRSFLVAGTPQQLANVIEEGAAGGGLFDVLIIDEAGAMDVAHASLAIRGMAAEGALILAGDPKQLPPIHSADAPAGLEKLVGSIYEFYTEWCGVEDQRLLENYRSNDEIVKLSHSAGYDPALRSVNPDRRIFYADAAGASLMGGEPAGWTPFLPFSSDLLLVADPASPVTCITHSDGVSGQWNQFEADTVAALIFWYRMSLLAGVDASHLVTMTDEYFWTRAIGVVTPHRAQRSRIVDRLIEVFDARKDARLLAWINDAVDTVERFQGQERDIILASYAVGDPDTVADESEFLLSLNRFNVLSTRARAKLVVVLSRELASHIGTDLKVLQESEMIKDFVDLYCNDVAPIAIWWTGGETDCELRVHRPD